MGASAAKEALQYEKLFCGKSTTSQRDWTSDKGLVKAFCTACEDQYNICDDDNHDEDEVTRGSNTAISPVMDITTSPAFIPRFLCVVLFSGFVAVALYISQR